MLQWTSREVQHSSEPSRWPKEKCVTTPFEPKPGVLAVFGERPIVRTRQYANLGAVTAVDDLVPMFFLAFILTFG